MNRPRLDDSILRYIRTDFTPLRIDQTVGQALDQLRAKPPGGRVVYFYVVDADNRLEGVVPARLLLLKPVETKIEEIMIRRVVAAPSTASVMDVCELFIMHKFLAIPIIDGHRHLLGMVDIELYTEEIADVHERTDFEDLFQLIGVHVEQARAGSPFQAFRNRFPWLLSNIIGGLGAAFVAGWYEGTLNRMLALAMFIPIVLSLSESISIQSVSLAIQALHGAPVGWADLARALRREAATGLLLGLAMGPIVAAIAWIWKRQGALTTCLWLAIGLAALIAAVVGLVLPLALRLLRKDPRVAAGPIALATADLLSLFVYLNIAHWLLA
jgi:magnesium transporter